MTNFMTYIMAGPHRVTMTKLKNTSYLTIYETWETGTIFYGKRKGKVIGGRIGEFEFQIPQYLAKKYVKEQ